MSEITDSKDMYKVWRKVKEMKNGFNLQSYHVKLQDNIFPSSEDKAEAFAKHFSVNSLSNSLDLHTQMFRKKEEIKAEYEDPIPDNLYYLNAPINYEEFLETVTLSSNVGVFYQYLIQPQC